MRMIFGFRSCFLAAFFLVVPMLAPALLAQETQVPQVPPVIRFADMTLHLTEQAQRDIQSDVDALYRSPKYFYMKLERVDMYLPIIEPIFAEMGIPDDIKYLVIQESALISDAVSSSNAVGFWQFKEASATELGMRVDRQVDERMNIVAATVGAAKYFLRSNATFDNWLYSLQSYQMGLGGASRSLPDRYYGAREMRIDSDTYWYVKKFLSHLVAFRDAIGKQPRSLMLYQYKNTANKSLQSIAEEFDTDPDQLVEYNKWLKTSRVPDDRPYVVMIPVQLEEAPNLLAESQGTTKKQQNNQKKQTLEDKLFGQKQKEPEIPVAVRDQLVITEVNGLRAVVARPGDNSRDLAKAGSIPVANFLKYNDIKPGDALVPGQVYYFRKKKRKASVYRHVLAEGESLWDVSQKYGIRMNKLLQKNRMKQADGVKPGQVLWLRYIRPADEPVAFEAVPKRKADANLLPDEKMAVAPAAVQEPQNQQRAQQQEIRVVKAQLQQTAARQEVATEQRQYTHSPTASGPFVAEQAVKAQDQQTAAKAAPAYPQEQNTVLVARPVNEIPAAPQTRVPQAADTPVTKPAAVNALPENRTAQSAAAAAASSHLYPGAGSAQRNVYLQNQENAKAADQQAVAGVRKADPDSFSVSGPVKFIGEDGKPEAQPQLRPAVVQAEPVQVQAQSGQAAAVAQPVVAQTTTSLPAIPATDSVHVVQAGETLYSISRRYSITVEQLRSWNNMGAEAVLGIGQSLHVKPKPHTALPAQGTSASAPQQQSASVASAQNGAYEYHTVGEGETMYRVARKYNVTIKDIMEWNKREDFNIRPGEVLIVGKK